MNNFATKVIDMNRNLDFSEGLPFGYKVLNPYLDNPETMEVMEKFYKKYYNDNRKRKFIIGINPSRHGAGVTGVPFTDTKRLETECGIKMNSARTHEVSSVFMYDMIRAFGGVEKFYSEFYINSPFPLAILKKSKRDWVNANYYDDKSLFYAVEKFMIASIEKHISLGLDTEKVFCLGKKNAEFLEKINQKEKFFGKLIPLEHPRYIQQYKSKEKEMYIDKYLISFSQA
ncbi:MAG: SMUG2 DNA glycosylase family protein [Bacteroidetes bacterium]|nr:SMUG2 DNA glycosylase family protein [Bacteroidota bacterium]